jgi:hypothetical protein
MREGRGVSFVWVLLYSRFHFLPVRVPHDTCIPTTERLPNYKSKALGARSSFGELGGCCYLFVFGFFHVLIPIT